MHSATGGGQGTGVMAKDFDSESWMRGNKNDFDELVRRAREKKARAPATDDKANEPGKGLTRKNTALEISRDASASTRINATSSEATSQAEPEAGAGVGASPSKSPFFDRPGDTETEVQINTLRQPPPKDSQSQGSHVNGVLA
jgi:hypothetical protein